MKDKIPLKLCSLGENKIKFKLIPLVLRVLGGDQVVFQNKEENVIVCYFWSKIWEGNPNSFTINFYTAIKYLFHILPVPIFLKTRLKNGSYRFYKIMHFKNFSIEKVNIYSETSLQQMIPIIEIERKENTEIPPPSPESLGSSW
ncbi:hypothetical protein IEQ34_002573 [Dendrobium chrysotoxum]|uniref:Uncharacterized protein n=1 Tax=Dendrobium chrysotoxum TaxID=161865 RepID=A0AAV7HJP8_DENCH|nr:hypothetical protein IEQ34_002573 [Dendrobium chrysotoxum]